jgi:hypothetical protein
MQEVSAYLAVAELCFRSDYVLASCREYRVHAGVALLITLLLLGMLTYAGLRFLRRRRQRADLVAVRQWEARNHSEEREATRWRGDEIADPHRNVAELTSEIRGALQERKLNGRE